MVLSIASDCYGKRGVRDAQEFGTVGKVIYAEHVISACLLVYGIRTSAGLWQVAGGFVAAAPDSWVYAATLKVPGPDRGNDAARGPLDT